jgi:hypothetical protein
MHDKITETLNGLKDFQSKTVDYVFEQLYTGNRPKMLIADEVGLGKTIVAKGIIAKAFGQFMPQPAKPVFNVIYICSNQALARQNLKKLNFTGDNQAVDYSEEDDRLTGLAYISPKEERQFPFRIKAFTPATSFDDKTHAGRADERVLLYRLLYQYSDIEPFKNSLKWILKGNRKIKDEKWEEYIQSAEGFDNGKNIYWLRKIRPRVYSEFKKALDKTITPDDMPRSFTAVNISYPIKYWTLLRNLCELGIRKNNYYSYNFSRELISSLRFRLSRVCVEFLQADIFILDEFQRYKQLIETSATTEDEENGEVSPAIQLARDVLSFENSRILMLSATPFKPYTNDFDELNGEVHYREFKTVLKFLMGDKSEAFWQQYEQDRRAFFSFLRHPDVLEQRMTEAIALKTKLEELYRTSIVRTERLLASEDRDALIKEVQHKPLTIQPEDINDFIVLDQITQLLNVEHDASLPIPLEYVKSSPYPMSFLDNYQHKEKVRRLALHDNKLQQLLKKTRHGWLNLEDINQYKPLIPSRGKSLPNAKLRLLLGETVHNNGWKYLWIPPSIPYYEFSGAYKESWGYSKTLIFSSWKMVPRMVASLVSYEAERLSIGDPNSISEKEKIEEKRYYFQKRRSPRPQFTFKVEKEEQEPQQMNNFILTYPCVFLSKLYDPALNITEEKTLTQIRAELKKILIAEFKKRRLNDYVSGQGDWQKWYWLAPLLLDKVTDAANIISEWFAKGIPASELSIDADNVIADTDENSGKQKHFSHASKSFLDNTFPASKLNDSQLEEICTHLVDLSLGSPAICYLRSQFRHNELSSELLDASFNVASAFLTMFNKPESIAVVRLQTAEGDYWQRALQYMIDGNIQAMLDEFIYLLIDCESIQSTTELSDYISDVLSVRTATAETEDLKTFLDNLTRNKKKRKAIRSHYALDFGNQRLNTAKGAGRQINIRQAFNSPFRPFVLATTSIGQEGLDFHLYCKKIFHWNLPSNPIDFEQREGRIHRYKGLVIRLNLADKYKATSNYHDEKRDVWLELFKLASKEKNQAKFSCDLVPFWHTESQSDIKIERFVPLYPFSRDLEKYKNLIRILTYYRLTFGQPRQEELIEALNEKGFSEEEIRKIEHLIINLSPICFF